MASRWTRRRFKIEWYCPRIPHRSSLELAEDRAFSSRINHDKNFLDIREVNSKC